MIDDQIELTTPEGVSIQLAPAGPVPRFLAYMIDLLIRVVIYVVAGIILAFVPSVGGGLILILMFLLEWFYPVLFEQISNGQTPGKKAMGLVVVHSNGAPVTFNGSFIRNLLRTADFLPAFFTAGLLTMLCNRRFQRLGDLAADTMVVHRQRAALPSVRVAVQELAPDWPADRDDQRVLVSFLERGQSLTRARRQELARIAWPEHTPEQAESHALGTARHMVGDG